MRSWSGPETLRATTPLDLRWCIPRRCGVSTCDVSFIFIYSICMIFMMSSAVMCVFNIFSYFMIWFLCVCVIMHDVDDPVDNIFN